MTKRYDVVTFGETMLRLSPPFYQRIEQTQSVDLSVGGSESNVAVGLARLGLKVAWFSALPNNTLGQYVEEKIATQAVDTSHIIWSDSGRLGLYWVEYGAAPRSTKVIYDRSHTAISQIDMGKFPKELFRAGSAKLLHISGITPALSDEAAEFTMRALEQAKGVGWKVSFDLNYRAKLWDAEQARVGCIPFMEQADILFAPYRDVKHVLKIEADSEAETLKEFQRQFPSAIIVMTIGAAGALAALPNRDIVHETGFEADTVDAIGAGDAFVAGFLSQYIEQAESLNLSNALRWANASAALKHTTRGDLPLISREDVIGLIEQNSIRKIQR